MAFCKFQSMNSLILFWYHLDWKLITNLLGLHWTIIIDGFMINNEGVANFVILQWYTHRNVYLRTIGLVFRELTPKELLATFVITADLNERALINMYLIITKCETKECISRCQWGCKNHIFLYQKFILILAKIE